MGKNGASSWFTVVRKAFSSPTKENDQRSSRIREDNEQEEEEKRRRKRRWIFKMPKEIVAQQCEARIIISTANIIETCNEGTKDSEGVEVDQSHAIAITMATAATSPAAVARAQAAVDVVRLAGPSICVKQYHAAVVIQTAFRGFLARIALRALRGVVTLQALVRGQNVRNRAQMTLRCMQAMLRVQTRMCKERAAKLSDENSTDYRKSMSNEYAGDNYGIYFGDSLQTVPSFQDVHSKLDEDALKREIALAYAFSHQIWGTGDDQSYSGEELEVNPEWSSQWSRNYRETGRASSDQREPVKIVEIDTYRPYPTNDDRSKNQQQKYCHQQLMSPNSLSLASPGRRASNNQYNHSPLTPSPVKARHLQVDSASPRCLRWSNSMPQMSGVVNNYFHGTSVSLGCKVDAVPNYMAATASAKARSRWQSAQRQGNATPEKERGGSSVKKRLSFPVLNP